MHLIPLSLFDMHVIFGTMHC